MKTLRVPLLLFALPALLLHGLPEAAGHLRLDRAAVFQGELWRLWTGHWVHFSTSHLLWNLAALLGAGAWLEHVRPGWLGRLALLGAPLVSWLLLVAEPAMTAYGGLSALATAAVTLLALAQLQTARADRPLWIALLLLVSAKVLHDAAAGSALFARFDAGPVRASRFAHLAGALVAVALGTWWRREGPPSAENDTAGTRDGFPAANSGNYP